MEAGRKHNELAQTTGMRYINGQDTVTYFGAILCRKKSKQKSGGV